MAYRYYDIVDWDKHQSTDWLEFRQSHYFFRGKVTNDIGAILFEIAERNGTSVNDIRMYDCGTKKEWDNRIAVYLNRLKELEKENN